MDLLARAAQLLADRKPAALVTVVEAHGSTPRKPGARMLVLADGSIRYMLSRGEVERDPDGSPRRAFGYTQDVTERVAMLREAAAHLATASVEPFAGLLVKRAEALGARVLVRGVRNGRDWDVELPMAFANQGLAPGLETVFLAPSAATALVSSSLVREVALLGGDVSRWVPPTVARALARRAAT